MASIARCIRPVGSGTILPSRISTRRFIFQRQSPSVTVFIRSEKGIAGVKSFSTFKTLEQRKYTKDHEWIELSDDGSIGTIGVSTYAAKALGDVVYVELPALELKVNAGDTIGAVESVKSASDIMTPVSGKIVEANEMLEEKPGLINKGPEGEGWIAKISVDDRKEIDELMSEEKYKAFTEE